MKTILFVLLLYLTLACTQSQSINQKGYEEGLIKVGDGIELFYQKIGTGKQNVLIPLGWWLYDDFKKLAENKDRTIVFYDVRNRFRSSEVRDSTAISFEADRDDIERIRKHFGFEKISLIGESYLGCVITMYAMKYPERVESLVQIGSVPYNFKLTFDDSLSYKVSQVDSITYKELISLYHQNYHLSHPKEFSQKYWNVAERINLLGDSSFASRLGKQWGGHLQFEREWYPNFTRHLGFHFKSFQNLDIQPAEIRKVKARVLTIAGTRDRNVPFGASKLWATLLPNARFLRVPGAGHIPWIENPDLVLNSIDQFLSGEWPVKATLLSKN
jgi:proline iminopeptidase